MRKILRHAVCFTSFALLHSTAALTQIVNYVTLDHNNVSCILSDEGGFFSDLAIGNAGYEVPKGGGLGTIFGGSFMISAQDPMGQVYFSGAHTSAPSNHHEIHSGPIADPFFYGSVSYSSAYQNALWKVSSEEIEFHQQNYQNPGYTVPNALLNWPGNGDATMGVAQQLAPYIDLNQNGIYEPILGDYPDIRGDEAVYVIMNDESYMPDGNQLRIELHAMFYQFSAGNYLNNTTFLNLRVINRSNINYMNYLQSIFMDFDLGNFSDDQMGCSPEKNLLFAYNGDDDDELNVGEGYGANPPCQGLVSLSHPLKCGVVLNTGQDYFANGDYSYWLLQNSQWTDTTPWVNPLTNQVTDFTLPDNPNNPNGWSEEALNHPSGDRRGMITIYEPSFRPGTAICSDYAFLYSRVGTRLQNVQDLWNIATSLQALYNTSEQFVCHGNSGVGITETIPKEKWFRISPNPASEHISIESNFRSVSSIEVYNSLGQVVFCDEIPGQSKVIISLEALPKGCYLIKASNGLEIFSEKLMVE
ncbi:MAG: T9SS C-terminal target domain-containing protein [Flavobacteriia bacterium]|nr:MAG: T9SS C-terminal target domain-containing protein [Flavobacteriia bacterium]